MSGPTEGPWFVDGSGARALIRGADQTIVATRHRLPADLHEANMHLAAAAPALLAACKMALVRGRVDDSESAMNQLASAIAAAEPKP